MALIAYYNAVVYTADENNMTAEAFIVEDGLFKCVGDNSVVEGCANKIDLEGKCVIPGLIDSHCHMFAGVTQASMNIINIDPSTIPEELGKVLLEHSKDREYSNLIGANGIDLTLGEFSAENIDSVINDRPVIVFSGDGHAILLNTYAMNELGINSDTPDPSDDSYYVRDAKGNPTGLAIEIPAMRPCQVFFDEPSKESIHDALNVLMESYSSLGYTGLFEALSVDDDSDNILKALKALDEEGYLPLRISLSFGYNGEDHINSDETIRIMKRNRSEFSSANVYPDTLKMIKDGTIEEHTALLSEPYSDERGGFGSSLLDTRDMMKAAKLAAKEGFNIHIHAIGDKAVSDALDVLTSVGRIKGTRTIAHNQLYSDSDIKRMSEEKDIFFQTTPHWTTGDEHTLSCLGKERFNHQFPVGTMQKNGVRVTFGTDSCLEPQTSNAFLGMFYACARGNRDLCGDENLPPEDEAITRMQALFAYTINGAKQLGFDTKAGSITPGKSADFVVLDRDVMECPLEDLGNTKVLETFFCGNRCF